MLFFGRFHATQPTLPYDLSPRPMTDACMRMWGQLLPKSGHSKWLCNLVSQEICDFFVGEDDAILDLVHYPYVEMDFRECHNIIFI